MQIKLAKIYRFPNLAKSDFSPTESLLVHVH